LIDLAKVIRLKEQLNAEWPPHHLVVHDLVVADHRAQGDFMNVEGGLGRFGATQDRLALQPCGDLEFVFVGQVEPVQVDDRSRVGLGLQQSWDEHRFVLVHGQCRALVDHQAQQVVRQQTVVHPEEVADVLLGRDPVDAVPGRLELRALAGEK